MSNHRNYNKMYNSGNPEIKNDELTPDVEPINTSVEEPVVEEMVVMGPAIIETPVDEEAPVDVPVEEPAIEEPKIMMGVVTNCERLNVRACPETSATVLNILPKDTEVQVITDIENDTWVHVCTAAGIDGFCMKQYISVKG